MADADTPGPRHRRQHALSNLTDHQGALTSSQLPNPITGAVLTAPTIADFTNAQHNHINAANGNTVDHTSLTQKGTNTHAQIDTAVTASTSHIAASTAVHGLPASVNVLGNRTSGGEFIQRGLATVGAGESSTVVGGVTVYYADATVTFGAAFSALQVIHCTVTATTLAWALVVSPGNSGFTLRIATPLSGHAASQSAYWTALGS